MVGICKTTSSSQSAVGPKAGVKALSWDPKGGDGKITIGPKDGLRKLPSKAY